jgi:hypothetical protein
MAQYLLMARNFNYKKHSGQKCFMCDDLANTGDHIPPKGFFPLSLRKHTDYNPLKVPACNLHNNISKLDDEYVRLILATGSPENQHAKSLFSERIIPRAKETSGSKLMLAIYRKMQPTLFRHSSGIITMGYLFEANKTRMQNVFKKIAYGLYWHHNGHRVPDDYEVSLHCYNREIPEKQIIAICSYPILSIGHPEVFEYRYAEIDNDKNKIYIAMMFYGSQLIEITIRKRIQHA